MTRVRMLGSISMLAALTSGDGVELGADGAPKAFRIWKKGDNPTDHGTHRFTDASATTLMAEQSARGNLYSIDVDHLSLNEQAPPESHKAVGWHRLDVRNGELWAVDVQWTDAVKAGLAKQPPEWRYFSPAYDVSKEGGEIVSYLNTALTNNPATWSVTALATKITTEKMQMNLQAIAAALFGDDDDKKKEARSALAGMNDLEKKAWKAYQKAALDEPEAEKAAEEPEQKAAADGDEAEKATAAEEPKKEPDGDEAEKKAAVAASRASEAELLRKLGDQDKRLKELEELRESNERTQILASRNDLSKEQTTYLAKQPVAKIRELLALIPKPAHDPAAAERVTATRGSQGAADEVRAARLPAAEHKDLVSRMGRQGVEANRIHWERNDRMFPMIDKVEAARVLAAHKAVASAPNVQLPHTIEAARRLEAQASATKGARR